MEKVKIPCSHCGQRLKIAPAALGKRITCPSCREKFVATAEEAPAPEVVEPEPLPDDEAPQVVHAPAPRPVDDDEVPNADPEDRGEYLAGDFLPPVEEPESRDDDAAAGDGDVDLDIEDLDDVELGDAEPIEDVAIVDETSPGVDAGDELAPVTLEDDDGEGELESENLLGVSEETDDEEHEESADADADDDEGLVTHERPPRPQASRGTGGSPVMPRPRRAGATGAAPDGLDRAQRKAQDLIRAALAEDPDLRLREFRVAFSPKPEITVTFTMED